MNLKTGSAPLAPPLGIRIALIGVIVMAVALSLFLNRPPEAAPETAAPGDFSAGRALVHLRAIAAVPRPTGSPAHRDAREYLLKALRAEGVEPSVQSVEVAVSQMGRPIPGGVVHNIIATLPGAGVEQGRAVLIASHYDSVAVAPGASDAGAAVAAMLETLRALRTGPPLRNDVVFLFTDAEETGLAGAQAFVDRHPLAARIGVALNFEARGSRGPVFMFETSEGNGWLIDELAAAAPHIAASSLSAAVYKRMPNFTDFTVFRKRGMIGMNFAYIGGLRHYHTEGDTIENLDPGSLQHHGSYMLAMARRLGAADLDRAPSRGDAVYFNALGGLFVHYSSAWAVPLAAGAAVVFTGGLALAVRRRRVRASRAGLGMLVLVLGAVASFLLVLGAWFAVRAMDGRFAKVFGHRAYDDGVYLTSFVLLAAGVGAAANAIGRRWASAMEIAAGGLAGWVLLAVVTAVLLPGGSYLFLWPALFASMGLGALVLSWRDAGSEGVFSGRDVLVLSVTAVPSLFLLAATIHGLFMASSLRASAGVAPLVTLVLGGIVAPHIAAVEGARKGVLSAALLAAGVVLMLLRCAVHG